MIESLTKQTFTEKFFDIDETEQWQYKGDKPCIIKFYSNDCVPCLRFKPTFEEMSEKYDELINFYEINSDIEIDLKISFDIQKVPTMIFVPLNDEPSLNGGSISKEKFEIIIKKLLLD